MKTPTDKQLNIAMCEWMGWTAVQYDASDGGVMGVSPANKGQQDYRGLPLTYSRLHDYLSDDSPRRLLNEAENRLAWEQRKPYHSALANAANFEYCEADTQEETSVSWNCCICHATARERTIAILQTVQPELFQ